jgi:hypothetical protein
MAHRVDAASIRAVLESATWPSMDAATLQKSITGEMPADLREAMRRDLLVAGTQPQVDAVTCAVLRHHGINPAVLFAMCIHATDVAVNDEAGHEIVGIGSDGLARVRLGADPKGAAWRTMGGYIENLPDAVPETVAAASAGMPVSSIVTHPAIDHLGLVVAKVERQMDASHVQVERFNWVAGEALARLLGDDACA